MLLRGRLFGLGLAPGGVEVEARLDALQLTVDATGPSRRLVPLGAIGLRSAGFRGEQCEFGWGAEGERHALLVDDDATIRQLLAAPPTMLAAALDQWSRQQRRGRRRRRTGLAAVTLGLALPLLLILTLLLAARPLLGRLANLVPIGTEQRLGAAIFDAQSARLDLIEDTSANRALEAIGARLTAGSRYRYRWYLARDDSLNAFALPGGIVVVHSGLIRAADDPSELAGVLAHEVEHVERRHSLQALAQQAGLRLAVAAVIGDVGAAGAIAGRLSGLRFSRDSEREADTLGLERLIRADYDPHGMLRLFGKLQGRSQSSPAPPAWLSSHPQTTDRIRELQALIEAQASTARLPTATTDEADWRAVQNSLPPPRSKPPAD